MPCPHVAWTLSRCLHVGFDAAQQPGLPEAQLQRALDVTLSQPIATRRLAKAAGASPTAAAAAADGAQQGIGRDSVDWLLELSGADAWLLAQPKMAPPPAAASDEARAQRRRPVDPGETCGICMEEMDDGEGEGGGGEPPSSAGRAPPPLRLAWCCHTSGSCGRALHVDCLRVWARHQEGHHDGGGGVTCPMCRAAWGPLGDLPSKAAIEAEGRRARQGELHDEFEQLRLREAASEVVRRRQQAALDALADANGAISHEAPPPPPPRLITPAGGTLHQLLTAYPSAGAAAVPLARCGGAVIAHPPRMIGVPTAPPPRRGGGAAASTFLGLEGSSGIRTASRAQPGMGAGEASAPPRPVAQINLFIYQEQRREGESG